MVPERPPRGICGTGLSSGMTLPPRPSDADPRPLPVGPRGLAAVGGDLTPGSLLAAYRAGMFPMPHPRVEEMVWWSPDPRAVLPVDRFVPSRSLRRMMRRYQITVNRAFGEVVSGCADPSRPGGWITGEVEEAYRRLHELGLAHSLETWEDGELAGGLYGVSVGGFFAGESMFHRRRDASKAALARLVEILSEAPEPLLDVQWQTPHLRSLGAVEIPRSEYLRRLAGAVEAPGPDWEGLSRLNYDGEAPGREEGNVGRTARP